MKIKQIPAGDVIAQLKAGARVLVAKELNTLDDLQGAQVFLIAEQPAPAKEPVREPEKEPAEKRTAKRIDYAKVDQLHADGIPNKLIAKELGCSEWSIAQYIQKKRAKDVKGVTEGN